MGLSEIILVVYQQDGHHLHYHQPTLFGQRQQLEDLDNYFLVVQLQELSTLHSSKFRTEIVEGCTNPSFYKNSFRFHCHSSDTGVSLRFGLFRTNLKHQPMEEHQVIHCSKPHGVASLILSLEELLSEKAKSGVKHQLKLKNGSNLTGSFNVKLEVICTDQSQKHKMQDSKREEVRFDPYQQNQQVVKGNIHRLQQMVDLQLQEYQQLQQKLSTVTIAQKKVDLTEIKLKDHVQRLEQANIDLKTKLNGKIDPETMLVSIELLKDSSKGQSLLLGKVDYAQQRLRIEKDEHDSISKKFREIEPTITQQISQVERHGQLVRDVKDQEFQMQRNNRLLKLYEQRMEKLRANDYTIKALKDSMKRPDLTAAQALILLQQARYKAKLEEYNHRGKTKSNKGLELLERIEGALKVVDKQEEYEFLEPYEFKLQALKEEISALDRRVREARR